VSAQLWVAVAAGVVGSVLGGLRWLRVAQREHYLAGSSLRFGWRWWAGSGLNRALWALGVVGVVVSAFEPAALVVTAGVVGAGPAGLGLRGRTSKLVWTGRLRRLALAWGLLQIAALAASVLVGVLAGAGAGGGAVLVGVAVLAVPAVMDLACLLAAPVERRLVAPFVASATARLASVGPVVVGITGSFGKTTTKGYVAHLLGGSHSVLASPASYNNRTGLARAINESLGPGTDVFVAEMGTYGPGEIAELCSWIRPSVSVITAIGPVHLERMRTEEAILAAKSEILVDGAVAVLNVDSPALAGLAEAQAASGRRVWRCSALDPDADVWVGAGVRVRGEALPGSPPPPPGAPATNVACAVAVALELGVAPEEVGRLLGTLPTAPNRLSRRVADGGFVILDDTYNSNPAGAALALEALAGCGSGGGRRVMVTPGMVELGERQAGENTALAQRAASVVTQMVVVGRTNRRALLAGLEAASVAGLSAGPSAGSEAGSVAGSSAGPSAGSVAGSSAGRDRPEVVVVRTREEAVSWVRDHLGPGDAVLYENDLPDHYP
jgi:UDP-N-acetylmuramoyl-tripeptide--D-alanyl-D-alanine ligase